MKFMIMSLLFGVLFGFIVYLMVLKVFKILIDSGFKCKECL